ESMVAVPHLTKIYEPRRRWLRGPRSPVRAVRDVDLAPASGRALASVRESGCGKSTAAPVLSGLEVATARTVVLDGVGVGALAVDPDGIGGDVPVSPLDVSVQAAIVNLLTEIQAARGATLVFISHDLAIVRYLADTVAVMYLGTVAELGPVERVFAPPYHPYTEALLSAVPVPDPDHAGARILLEGRVPRADEIPRGCPFATRCPRRVGPVCDETPPPVQQFG